MRNSRTHSVAIASALAVGVAGLAVAHETTFGSRVTVDTRPGPTQRSVTFFGDVKSENDRCIKNRRVELYDVRTLASKIGEAESGADGEWEISAPTGRLRGTQYVKVVKKTLVNRGRHHHKCKGDKTAVD